MIKKFFKAMLMGLWESETLRGVGTAFIVMGWLPLVAILILKIFKINMNEGESALFTISMCLWGIMISRYIIHCIYAMKYQDENHCDFGTAWRATEFTGDEY